MTYGNPGISAALAQLAEQPQDHILLFPLFPQYSATSTAPLYDAIAKWIPQQRNLPGLSIIRDYYQHPVLYMPWRKVCVIIKLNMVYQINY